MTRYAFSELARAMRMSEHAAAVVLGLSGSTEQDYRRRGMTERVADRLAVKVGLHPFEVWPEMVELHIAAEVRECAADGCTGTFLLHTGRGGQNRRYCSDTCRAREVKRRQSSDPHVRAREAARQAAYRASLSPAARRAVVAKQIATRARKKAA